MTQATHPDLGDTEAQSVLAQKMGDLAEKMNGAAPTAEEPPKKLTDAERLDIENTYLKMQNLQLQVQNLDIMKGGLVDQMRELQKEMETKRAALSTKYGVDISRTTVGPDGTIRTTPKPATPVNPG